MQNPTISIIVPSFNQAKFIGETLQSLLDQNYPKLEVIIQDGGSTDGAVEIAKGFADRHPDIFQVHVEKDNGQADALNRGFARAKGEILAYLNTDDTLYPGCLARVAEEIDPQRNRMVVFGRCLFTGEDSPYVGVEHPAEFISHYEHLAIWKRSYNTIPQPSVFWHRRVWEKEGGFNVQEGHVMDYDLFCRFSRSFHFHRVDQLWSTYRMHPLSKSSQKSEAEVLEMSIATSRRYWGNWFQPLRWKCEWSFRRHSQQTHERARHHARRTEKAYAEKKFLQAFGELALTFGHSPRMGWHRLLRPLLVRHGARFLNNILFVPSSHPQEAVVGADHWIGPEHAQMLQIPKKAETLVLDVEHHPQGLHKRVRVELKIDGKTAGKWECETPGHHVFKADVQSWSGKACHMELLADSYFIPNLVSGSPDNRKLSLQLHKLSFA